MKVAIIPARGGSKRIPDKNIKQFCGKPMIAWSIEAAQRSQCFDRIIVSTDNDKIAEVALKNGVEVPFMRPASLSDDYTPTIPVIAHAIDWLEQNGYDPTVVCCIYATAPFITENDLRNGFELLNSSDDCDYSFAVTRYAFPIQRALRITNQGRVNMFNPEMYNVRSQDLEEAWHDAGQFYWGRKEAWIAQKPIFSARSAPFVLPLHRVQDIDNPDDWESAELLFRIQNSTGHADSIETDQKRYLCMPNDSLRIGDYTLRAVQPGDIEFIRRWRNAQINVLRQNRHISKKEQHAYYREQVWPTMSHNQPKNILLCLFHHDRHIGYGGLVHIAWDYARAEVSFLLDNKLAIDDDVYAKHFRAALQLIKKLAFYDLGLNRLYTETWDFRKKHMAILELAGFRREGCYRQHVSIEGVWFDAVIHGALRHDET